MDPMESIKQGYFQECEELLLAMEEGLIAMENGENDSEIINAVFRAVHSIKGGGGAFGFDDLVAFAHSFETVMDLIRSNQLEAEPEVMKILLRAGDMLSDHVAAARTGEKLDPSHDEDSLAELRALSGNIADEEGELSESFEELGFHQMHPADLEGGSAPPPMDLPDLDAPAETPAAEAPAAEAPAAEEAAPAAAVGWRVFFKPMPGLYGKANEPALLLREMGELGQMEITAELSEVPYLEEMDPEGSYIGWVVILHGDIPKDSVEEVFDFVSDECQLEISPLSESASEVPPAEESAPEAPAEPAPTAVADPEAPAPEPDPPEVDEEEDLHEEHVPQSAAGENAPHEVASIVPHASAAKPAAAPAPASAKPAEKEAAASGKAESAIKPTIRVDLDKIDRLGNLAGELVITQAMLAQHLLESAKVSTSNAQAAPMLSNNMAEFEHLLRELQESVMAIRTQPVKSVFQRMPRLVRELVAQTGKSARLVIKGEATEVDKTVIERLGDPLTHMIRNAIDHGLESAEVRAAAGKDPEGTVTLSAEHRGGRIVIQVADDGGGINRPRVRQKAIEKGLIGENSKLSDDEIDNLIFLPGFSTAGKISNISGRGVGMDVVKSSVSDLGGRISLSSTPGVGSRFTMMLPLTLAVLDGMVVAVGNQTFVLPLTHIIESLQPNAKDIRPFGQNNSLLRVRDVYVPLVKVGQLMDVSDAGTDPTKGVVILVESEGTGRLALAVDQILGQRQVVIKSFEGNYRHIEGIGAATILGDGRVALILDVDGIVSRCRSQVADAKTQSNGLSATGTGQ